MRRRLEGGGGQPRLSLMARFGLVALMALASALAFGAILVALRVLKGLA